jgi:aryl-alcohol dehydrogenase-like predicted oxidoreductase
LTHALDLAGCLRAVGARYGRSPAQTAIRWVLDNEQVTCALVGAKTLAQVRENVGALGWSLESTDRERLAQPGTGRAQAE